MYKKYKKITHLKIKGRPLAGKFYTTYNKIDIFLNKSVNFVTCRYCRAKKKVSVTL